MTSGWSNSNRKARLPAGWSSTIVPRILARDPRCRLAFDCCTTTSTEVDHRIAGDDHCDANLQGVCKPCHKRKTTAESQQARGVGAARRRLQPPHPGLTGGGGG